MGLLDFTEEFEETLARAREEALSRELARPGERVVLTAGLPLHHPGTTNFLRVEVL